MKRLQVLAIMFALFGAVSVFAADEKSIVTSNFADFGGSKIYYQETGKGREALVFVHGWACNSDFWKESIKAFPNRRVIAVDLPGHGKSDKPQTAYTMDYFAESIAAVLKQAKVEKAVLVGHSMGTPVIRQFYRKYPKRTLGLVVVDGALRPFGTQTEMRAVFAPLKTDYRANAARFIDGMIQSIADEKLKHEIRSAMLSTPDYVGMSAIDGMTDEKIWTDDKINVPVLAILAESPAWNGDTSEAYSAVAPNIDFRMWQGVSHFLMMEKPKLFNKSVLLYLSLNKLL